MVFKGDTPIMALGTPGGDNQEQTILQAFLNVVEFWDDWYPNLHAAFEWPRFQTLHFHGSFWPHSPGFNKLNVEATIPDAGLQRTEGARARCEPHPAVRYVWLCHGRHDRSRDRQSHRRRAIRGVIVTRWRTDRNRQTGASEAQSLRGTGGQDRSRR